MHNIKTIFINPPKYINHKESYNTYDTAATSRIMQLYNIKYAYIIWSAKNDSGAM